MRRRTVNPVFWALSNLGSRVRYTPRVAESLTTADLPEESLTIPTRHGELRAVVVRPPVPPGDRADAGVPVLVQLHGGGFLNRCPEQDRHLARHLAADLGAAVVLPDYSTAPKVRYPVAEQEMYDAARWVQAQGPAHGWDGSRLLLSGISAGAELAIPGCPPRPAAGSDARAPHRWCCFGRRAAPREGRGTPARTSVLVARRPAVGQGPGQAG